MKFFEGSVESLLEENFGGEEIYVGYVKNISNLFKCNPSELIFTTSDIDFESVSLFESYINKKQIKLIDLLGLSYSNELGFMFVYEYCEGGLSIITLNKNDKEKFKNLIKLIK